MISDKETTSTGLCFDFEDLRENLSENLKILVRILVKSLEILWTKVVKSW